MIVTTSFQLTPDELKEIIRVAIKDAIAEMNSPGNLRLKEAANYLGISTTSLYRHVTSGKIKAGRAGAKIWNFRKEDLDEWVSNSKTFTLTSQKKGR